jgi:hypothetical protein
MIVKSRMDRIQKPASLVIIVGMRSGGPLILFATFFILVEAFGNIRGGGWVFRLRNRLAISLFDRLAIDVNRKIARLERRLAGHACLPLAFPVRS